MNLFKRKDPLIRVVQSHNSEGLFMQFLFRVKDTPPA